MLKKHCLFIIVATALSIITQLKVYADDLSVLIEFNMSLQPVSISEMNVEPASTAVKLHNGNYLYSVPQYIYEIHPGIPQEIERTYLTDQPVLVGEFADGNRIWLEQEKLKKLTATGKRILLYKDKNRVYDAKFLGEENLLITSYDIDKNLEYIDASGKTIWSKAFPVEKLCPTTLGTVLAIKPARKIIAEINMNGNIVETLELDYPVKTALKITSNQYLILKQDQEEVLLVNHRGTVLFKLEGMQSIFNISLLDKGHFAVLGRTQVQDGKTNVKFKRL